MILHLCSDLKLQCHTSATRKLRQTLASFSRSVNHKVALNNFN